MLKTRPLVEFRAAVNDLISQGVEPTATNITKVHGDRWTYERSFKDGYLSRAREEELIKAGWRRVAYNENARNFRWMPIKRKTVKGVNSKFRVGDVCIPFSRTLVDAFGADTPRTVKVTGYENGALLDRDDLPRGATALVIQVNENDHFMLWDDELVLVTPSSDYPLK